MRGWVSSAICIQYSLITYPILSFHGGMRECGSSVQVGVGCTGSIFNQPRGKPQRTGQQSQRPERVMPLKPMGLDISGSSGELGRPLIACTIHMLA